MSNKVALVLEGGGLRGVFTAGVIDNFLENNIKFDYVVGVSAGACNTFAYVGKAHKFIKKCMIQKNPFNSFYGVPQMIGSHKYVNLEKVFYDYTKQYGFSYEKFSKSRVKWEMVASNIETGEAEYLTSKDIEKAKLIGKASCSLPILTDPVAIDGKLYLDGGICDSIPIEHALSKGYDKIVVVCTRKKGHFSKVKDVEKPVYKNMYERYPLFLKAVNERTDLYRRQVELCEELEKEGKVILIRPTMPEVGRLESDEDELNLAYYHGYTKAKDFISDIKKWTK